MAVNRCPQCNLPMTEEEYRAGTCPECAALLPRESLPAPKKPDVPAANSSSFLLWTFCGGMILTFLLLGILLNHLTREKPAEKPPEETIVAQQNQPVVKKSAPHKETAATKKEPDFEKKAADEPKEPEPKKDAPKQPVPPKREPKKNVDVQPIVKKPEKAAPVQVKQPEPKLAPMPGIKQARLANIPFLNDSAIKIDGDLADWKDIQPVFLTPVERGKSPKKPVVMPPTQKAYIAYCSKGILVAVDVVDTSGELENEAKPLKGMWSFWNNDTVEIYIDTLNKRQHERGNPNAHQFFAFPFGTKNDETIGGYESKMILLNRKLDWAIVPHLSTGRTAMLRAGKKTPTGWTMEILIPKTVLRLGEIKPGKVFGFELQIDTGTNIFYFWACDDPLAQVSTHPNRWGEIFFAGSDASIELIDVGQQPIKSFVPGKPLIVRVTDPDCNLSPLKKDKISVTLRNGGASKVLILNETQPDSGVFVGAMPTQLNIGGRPTKGFEVKAGENIIVEYVDQLRSNGDRDVTLRANFTATTPGGR